MAEPFTRETWDAFVHRHGGSFLQSWDWGVFQTAVGNAATRVGDIKEGWVAQWVRQRVQFGEQLACYHGPVPATTAAVRHAVHDVGPSTTAKFLHLELPYGSVLPELPGWIPTKSRQAPATRILDLTQPLDDLQAGLHPKTRYNIRVAERHGVTVRAHADPSAIGSFLLLLPRTSERHGIAAHAPAHYRTMADLLMPKGMLYVFLAEVEGAPVAAHLVLKFGATATYLHGASDYAARSAMAPHLLQWHQIRWAKEQGCTTYDFWGVAPPGASPHHPFAGITRFKEGFGGRAVASPGSFDLPRQRLWYTLYRAAKTIRG